MIIHVAVWRRDGTTRVQEFLIPYMAQEFLLKCAGEAGLQPADWPALQHLAEYSFATSYPFTAEIFSGPHDKELSNV